MAFSAYSAGELHVQSSGKKEVTGAKDGGIYGAKASHAVIC